MLPTKRTVTIKASDIPKSVINTSQTNREYRGTNRDVDKTHTRSSKHTYYHAQREAEFCTDETYSSVTNIPKSEKVTVKSIRETIDSTQLRNMQLVTEIKSKHMTSKNQTLRNSTMIQITNDQISTSDTIKDISAPAKTTLDPKEQVAKQLLRITGMIDQDEDTVRKTLNKFLSENNNIAVPSTRSGSDTIRSTTSSKTEESLLTLQKLEATSQLGSIQEIGLVLEDIDKKHGIKGITPTVNLISNITARNPTLVDNSELKSELDILREDLLEVFTTTDGYVDDYLHRDWMEATHAKKLYERATGEQLLDPVYIKEYQDLEETIKYLKMEKDILNELQESLKNNTLFHTTYIQMDHHSEPSSKTEVGLNMLAIADPGFLCPVVKKYIGSDYACSLHELKVILPVDRSTIDLAVLSDLPLSTIQFGLSKHSENFSSIYRAAIYSPETFYNLVCPGSRGVNTFDSFSCNKILKTVNELDEALTTSMIETYHYAATMLGSGNHFAEIGDCVATDDNKTMLTIRLHVGSRSLGAYFQQQVTTFGYSYARDQLDATGLSLITSMLLALNVSYSTALLYIGTICMVLTNGMVGHENMIIKEHNMLPHNYFNVQLGVGGTTQPLLNIEGDKLLFKKVSEIQQKHGKSVPMIILRKGSTTFYRASGKQNLTSKVMVNAKEGVLTLSLPDTYLQSVDSGTKLLRSLYSVPHGCGRSRPTTISFQRALEQFFNTNRQETHGLKLAKGALQHDNGLYVYNTFTEGKDAYKSSEVITNRLTKHYGGYTIESTKLVIKENPTLRTISRVFIRNSIIRVKLTTSTQGIDQSSKHVSEVLNMSNEKSNVALKYTTTKRKQTKKKLRKKSEQPEKDVKK